LYLAGGDSPIVESIADLVTYFSEACTPRSDWRVGTEHEMIGVLNQGDLLGKPVPYAGPNGLTTVLQALEKAGWTAVKEGENIIALTCRDTQVSIEPGAQLEHAARPHKSSDALAKDLQSFLDFIAPASAEIGATWISTGFRPWGTLDDVGWIPKYRYDIMREYLPTRGKLAHEMMKRTATVQVNLDYSSEIDARNKMRAMMSTTSLLTAIYANSPIVDGKDSGFQSYRGHVWTDMDPDRCGLLDFVFEDDDFFRRYTEWALDVPMFFVHRDTYVDAKAMTFRQFMESGFEGEKATMDDWGLHLSTLFPDGRMKQYLEVRSCDASTLPMTIALGALCCGYLYDETACANAIALTSSLSSEERVVFADAVNRQGLDAPVPGTTLTAGDLAVELVEIARDGLRRVDPGELGFLEPVAEVVETRRTHATRLLELWNEHKGDPGKLLPLLSYH
jgi:glutamate--cysteine ligase